ncbi:MAG: insulinase family protein [Litoreibacter sp.]|nr:insulinase family protein [Litoreibacter sp.]
MIRIIAMISALAVLSACKDDVPTASNETSPSGIAYTLITLPDHEDVSIHVAWPTDWAYRSETNKSAPLIGTQLILAGGAEGFPAGDVVEMFADLNSEGTVYAAVNDHIIGELTFERSNLDETIEIANAHLSAPTLDETWFTRIRDGTAQNMGQAQAQPAHASFDAVRWAVFGEAPLRNALSLDDPETFETITREDITAWHQETFTRNPEAIVIAGDIDADTAGAAVDALLEGLPDTVVSPVWETPIDLTPKRILLHDLDAQVTNLAFLALMPSTREGGELEDLILTHALGGDDQSALFEAVRTNLRASYAFGAGISNYTRAHRLLFMTGEVEDEKLAEAETVVRNAYEAFQNSELSGPLQDRKTPFEASFAELSEFVVDQARSELQSSLDGFDVGRSLQMSDELEAVSESSVLERLQNDLPQIDDFIVVAVSPNANALPGACVIHEPREAVDCP